MKKLLREPLAPRQKRSADTLNRILDNAEALLESTSFERLSIHTIIRRANTHAGSFYARFADKSALLGALYQRYIADIEAEFALASNEMEGLSGAEKVQAVVGFVAKIFTTRRGITRSAALHSWGEGEAFQLIDALSARLSVVVGALLEILVKAAKELERSGDPRRRATFALRIIMTSSREHFLFGHRARTLRISEAQFQAGLSRMVRCYLEQGEYS